MGRKPTGKAGKTRRRSGTAGRSSNTENTGAEAGAESATAPDPAQVETGPDGAGAEAGSGPAEGGPRMETFDRLTPEPNVDTPPNDQVSELLAEANAGLAAAPADIELHQLEQGAQLAAGPDPAEGWKPFTDNTVSIVAIVALPQWHLTPDEKGELSASVAGCLGQLFPDGLNGKWACWFRLVACAGGITLSRMALNNGKIPGFGPRRTAPAPAQGQAANAA